MESSSDDELCDDGMHVGGEAQVRGMNPALMFLLLATCEWPAGAWPEPQTNPQKNELGHQLAAHDALGVLADVQDGPFNISVPARVTFYRLTNECIDAIVEEFPVEFG
mmetsp:Transcript_81418/g.131976  ORF Transcript_81418/g.131976 Transcript_81418/m.131976 type:complete len:108 (+) Transcript_81418:125-448(+)